MDKLEVALISDTCFAGNNDFSFGGQTFLPETSFYHNHNLPTLRGDRTNYPYTDAMTTQPITLPKGKVVNIGSEDDWKSWETWRVNENDLETLTGYDFLSNLPTPIQESLEEAGIAPCLTASLSVKPILSAIEIPNTTVGHNRLRNLFG